jgi:tetratricopeptide (TPR) repeat protein
MSNRKELERAVALFNEGRLATSEGIMAELDARYPQDVEVAHFGGVLANRMGRYETAAQRLSRAVRLQPRRAKAHAALGFALEQLGRLEDAGRAFDGAISADPRFGHAYNGKGVILVKLGDPSSALAYFDRAMALDASSVEPRLNSARALIDLGREAEAARRFAEAARLARDDEALRMSAEGLQQAGDSEAASNIYRGLVERRGDDASLRAELALALETAGRGDEALAAAQAAVASAGSLAAPYNAYGQLLLNRHRHDEAIAQLEIALERDPANLDAAFNLATALRAAGRNDKARAVLDGLEPRLDAVGLASLAVHYSDLGDSGRCIAVAERAISRDPSISAAHSTLAMELLRTGDVDRGWREYAYRPWRGSEILADVAAGRYPTAMPGDLRGRDVLILSEQGLGDMLFFLRYARFLADAGARLHAMRFDPRLVPMIARSIEIDVWPGDRAVPGDVIAIWAGDLPVFTRSLGGDASRAFPLSPLPDRVSRMRERLGHASVRRIGVAWRAGTRPSAITGRKQFLWKDVTPRAMGEALAGLPVQFVSIQRNPEEGATRELERALGANVVDASDANADLEDMLALLSLLDGYAGVSSTNIHLLAGLGRGGNVLVPFPPDWRWQASGRSEWFPGFAAHRQSSDREWAPALGALRADIDRSR